MSKTYKIEITLTNSKKIRLELDTWDVSNVENMERIFDDCPNIEVYPSWYKE